MRLDDLNALDGESAAREPLRCCGSTGWARLMAAARPFAGVAMTATADAIWWSLLPADWLEAFAADPRSSAIARPRPGRQPSSREANGDRGRRAPGLRWKPRRRRAIR